MQQPRTRSPRAMTLDRGRAQAERNIPDPRSIIEPPEARPLPGGLMCWVTPGAGIAAAMIRHA